MLKWKFQNKLNIWHWTSKTTKVLRYVVALYAFKQKERGDETQFTTKIGGKTNLGPSYFIL
jgi:hypothetical protein